MKITIILPVLVMLAVQGGFCQTQPEAVIVIKDVNLIPMTSEMVVPRQTLLITGAHIFKIGDSKNFSIPRGATVIDGTGKYLLPGLADMHTHYGGTLEHSYLNLFIAHGVTTIRDLPQGSPPSLLALREEIKAGRRLGPRLLVAGHLLGSEAEPARAIPPAKDCAYDGIKLNSYFTRKGFLETVAAAQRAGLYAFGHLPFLVGFDDILDSGFRESSHVLELAWYLADCDIRSLQDPASAEERILGDLFAQLTTWADRPQRSFEEHYRPRIKAIVAKIGTRGFSVCTTMLADHDIMNKVLHIETIKNSGYSRYIARAFWEDIRAGKDKHLNLFSGNPKLAAMVYRLSCLILRELAAQKVFLVLGTDVGPTYLSYIPGLSVHQELRLLVANGLTPYQALSTATRNAAAIAKKMGAAGEFGTIETGQRADLLLLDKDPLRDITNTERIIGVLVGGNYYPRAKLDSFKDLETQNAKALIAERCRAGGADDAIRLYRSLKDDNFFNRYYYNENTLLAPAYERLTMNLPEDALKLFLLNVKEYPCAANAWDSLAEGYLKKGERSLAMESYRKALSLDPGFASSLKALQELDKQRQPEEEK